MRVLARISYALTGLALVAPAAALAGMPIPAPGPANPNLGNTPKPSLLRGAARPSKAPRLCGECQRQKLMKETGVPIPPPPPLPPGTPVAGEECTRCGRPTAVVSGPALPTRTIPGSVLMAGEAPGRATVGGDEVGYASVGNEPAPIGTVNPRLAAVPLAGAARPGSRDPSVLPSSFSGPNEPVGLPSASRPHVLSHLFNLDMVGRERAETRERRRREKHAAISYGAPNEPVTELPAKMVFGRDAR